MTQPLRDFADETQIKLLTERICYQAKRLGLRGENLKDCIQEILTEMLERKKDHTPIEFCVIDWMRKNFSDPRTKTHEAKRNLNKDSDELCPNLSRNQDKQIDFKRFCNMILKTITTKEDRAIFKLKYEWGFYNNEIADILECHESLISMKIKSMLRGFKV